MLAMAPHLTDKELDQMFEQQGKGKTPIQIHTWLVKKRAKKGQQAQDLTNVRRVLKGKVYKRGVPETRGGKRALTRKQILKLDGIRKKLLKKADSESSVTWSEILRVGRFAMKVTATTVAKNFQEEGIDVKWRPARDAMELDKEQKVRGAGKHLTSKAFN